MMYKTTASTNSLITHEVNYCHQTAKDHARSYDTSAAAFVRHPL